ncbi:MAG: phage tail protein [Zoogloeaceae bacterium]|jgi:hypothetical protein|nr:phage tail protein [Zoogloeaceae bacterium]
MGSSKKVKIGYWYGFGIHMGISRGPLNEIVQVNVGDKTAWSGSATGNASIRINRRDLFGGEKKEGGIDGTLQILMGAPEQTVLGSLASMLGGLVPAFRGVATGFFDGWICAMSPYPKPWSFRVRRSTEGWEGSAWYPAKCMIQMAGGSIHAMNPAHILYQIYTDHRAGAGLATARLDDAAWRAAADTLYTEGFGLCLKWSKKDSVESFAQAVLDHVGGSIFVDRQSGLLKLKLVRGDYDPATLPHFDAETGLLELEEFESAAIMDAPNEVIVKFISPTDGKDRQVRQRNLAAIFSNGAPITQTTDYPGIPTADLAARVAARDLKSLSGNIKRFVVKLDRRGALIMPGDVFRIAVPDVGVDNMVVRAGRCEYGEGEDGTVKITAVQDVFGLPTTAYNVDEPSGWTPPSTTPLPAPAQRVMEVGYRDLYLRMGAGDLAQIDPAAAFLAGMATSPGGLHTGFDVAVKIGSAAWVATTNSDSGSFCITATLAADVPIGATTLTVTADLASAFVGSAVMIDDEILSIAAVNAATGVITVGRGCVDTVPAPHLAGAALWFYDQDDDYGFSDTEYIAGQTLLVRLPTVTTTGSVLPIASAPESTLTMTGRQNKPYPPGQMRINNQAYPATITGQLAITWAHRDRITQADLLVDTTQGNIGPEPGVTYRLRLYGQDGALKRVETGITGTSYTWTTETIDSGLAADTLNTQVRVVLDAVRDGIYSHRAHDWTVIR